LDGERAVVVELASLCNLKRIVAAVGERGGWSPDELPSCRRGCESADRLKVVARAFAEDDGDRLCTLSAMRQ